MPASAVAAFQRQHDAGTGRRHPHRDARAAPPGRDGHAAGGGGGEDTADLLAIGGKHHRLRRAAFQHIGGAVHAGEHVAIADERGQASREIGIHEGVTATPAR
jgi:hypothetical protein